MNSSYILKLSGHENHALRNFKSNMKSNEQLTKIYLNELINIDNVISDIYHRIKKVTITKLLNRF